MVVNNELQMVYYLTVYTVLLVRFPKKKFVGPPHPTKPGSATVSLHFRFEYEDAVSIGAGALILSERFEPFPEVLRLSLGVYM